MQDWKCLNTCRVKLKKQMASEGSTEVSPKTAPCEDARSCKKLQLIFGGVVAIAAILLVTTVTLSFILFARWKTPEENQIFLNKLLENLQQCQRRSRDLKKMLHSATQDSRCGLCPESWLWWRNHCYFFSVGLQDDRQWNKSAQFCQQHNSSLVVIEDSAEMDFLQEIMSECTKFPFLWVGLTDSEEEGLWLWLNGGKAQHSPLVTVQWDSDEKDCADLRGGGTLFASKCDEHGPWVCKKES